MCAISIVVKFRLVAAPKSRPTKTNISIREIPVIISGLIMGILVTVSRDARRSLLRSLSIPTAAAVPITVEIRDALNARIRVLRTERSVSVSLNNSLYQLREKPEKTDRLLLTLKEKTNRIAIGANRKIMISAV